MGQGRFIFTLALMCFFDNGVMGANDCQVANIKVQDNFNLSQYLGTWHEIKWVAPFYEPSDIQWSDYIVTYKHKDSNNTDGYGRARNAKGKCLYFRDDLTTTTVSGKLAQNVAQGETNIHWVLKTDYINFAAVYGCEEENSTTGTCSAQRIWIFGRKNTLATQYLQQAEAAVESACVNVSSLAVTEYIEDCPDETSDASSGCVPATILFLTYLSLNIL